MSYIKFNSFIKIIFFLLEIWFHHPSWYIYYWAWTIFHQKIRTLFWISIRRSIFIWGNHPLWKSRLLLVLVQNFLYFFYILLNLLNFPGNIRLFKIPIRIDTWNSFEFNLLSNTYFLVFDIDKRIFLILKYLWFIILLLFYL